MQPEYYCHEALRWGFGFENPNKAAVLFACLLPIFWTLWALSWRTKSPGLRVVALVASATLILADALCLFLSYSRGGAVAAAGGLAYLIALVTWNRRPWKPSQIVRLPRFYLTMALLGGIAGLFWWLGVGTRALESAGDKSVENRVILWRYALQMAVENPAGFGAGKSGDAYMQWYQPLEMTSGYRTMVNSYLTFLVEQGWLAFTLFLLGGCLLWFWASPVKSGGWSFEVAASLRASVLTFAASGVFSTVMETGILWIIPSLCAGILLVWTLRVRRPLNRKGLVAGASVAAVACLILFVTGWSRSDGLIREFRRGKDGTTIAAIRPWTSKCAEWVIAPDTKILGRSFGKLLRRLCLETGMRLRLDLLSARAGDNVILVGDSVVEGGLRETPAKLVLLAPKSLGEGSIHKSLSGNVLLLLPQIDEDGRTTFWREAVRNFTHDKIKVVQLGGVGLRADWAWDQVIEAIRGW